MRIEVDVEAARAWLAQPPQSYAAVAAACLAALVAYAAFAGAVYRLFAHPRMLKYCQKNDPACYGKDAGKCRQFCSSAAIFGSMWPIYMAWLTVRYTCEIPIRTGLRIAGAGRREKKEAG